MLTLIENLITRQKQVEDDEKNRKKLVNQQKLLEEVEKLIAGNSTLKIVEV